MFVNKEILGVDSGDYDSAVYFSGRKKTDKVSHDPIALQNWFSKLDNQSVVFACESKNDVFVKNAIDYGFSVFSTTTIQASHLRKLTHLSGKKDDPSDAKIHAIGLKTRPDIFREVHLDLESVQALKLLCNLRDGLIGERIAHENQLRSLLKSTFPALHQRRIKLSVQWVLRFLIAAPQPNLFREVKDDGLLKRLAKTLKLDIENLRNVLSPFQIKESKALEIASQRVRYLAQRNLEKLQMIRQYEREMREILDQLNEEYREEDVLSPIEILYSYPQMGVNTLARLVAEYPAILTDSDSNSLCAFAGVIPVTSSSGRMKNVHRRWSRNKKLQTTFCLLAKNTLSVPNAKMRAMFTKHRANGKREYHAYRAMSRTIIRTLCAMLKTKTLYKSVFKLKQLEDSGRRAKPMRTW